VDFVEADFPRRLVLLRHAKSDWPEDVADHDRPLAARGRRDAPLVGRWLAAAGHVPDDVVCSTAHRARQTWDLASATLKEACGASPPVRYEPRVYEATVLGLLMLVRELPDERRVVAIVGHNPGIAELAVGLAAPPPQPPVSFPTAAVAVLGLPGTWESAGPAEARLLAFAVPADMRG
jgi:phosphohistidine phosphatase